jgi:hypothetical protein
MPKKMSTVWMITRFWFADTSWVLESGSRIEIWKVFPKRPGGVTICHWTYKPNFGKWAC